MKGFKQGAYHSGRLSRADFKRLAGFIAEKTGIRMPPENHIVVESLLRKRLIHLKIGTYGQYCDFLFSPEGMERELSRFMDAVTTGGGEFFRESDHFEFLGTKAVPELAASRGSGLSRKLMIWSAAARAGNEAYSLAVTMSEFNRRYPGMGLDWEILASDISGRALKKGERAIYDGNEVSAVPEALKKRYLLRSRDRSRALVRIVPELRKRVRFRKIDLRAESYRLREPMDIIFCRDVFSYFDPGTRDGVVRRLVGNLRTGGFLFTGQSERIDGGGLPLVALGGAVYRKS